jgi:hypothetical protein
VSASALRSPWTLLLVWTTSCGPFASFRPISALISEKSRELGLGAVTVSPRPYVDEPWRQAGQLWFTARATSWLNVSAISAFDAGALGVGVGAAMPVLRSSRFVGGVEAEAGYGWAAAGIPLAGRLFEQTWLYSAPRITNFGIYPAVGVPVGLSLHVQQGAFVRLEYQASWMDFQAYNLRHHLGAALAVQW